MEIHYRGRTGQNYARIETMTQVTKCIARDTCGQRCDSLEIEFENAATWYRWGPEEDDEIIVRLDGYDTGIMYLNTILPEEGKYRMLATSLPCAARKKEYRSFRQKTIEDIMRTCGAITGMSIRTFGIDAKTVVPYAQQENESAASFLERLLRYEGAYLKCVNGNYMAIGLEYAQQRPAIQNIRIEPNQQGAVYRKSGAKLKSLTIKTPYANATAEDFIVESHHAGITLCDLPATSDIQAGRWARNLLRYNNMQCESLSIETTFNPGMTAMTRIDVTGDGDMSGEWLIVDVQHDLFNRSTSAKMLRCVDTVQ